MDWLDRELQKSQATIKLFHFNDHTGFKTKRELNYFMITIDNLLAIMKRNKEIDSVGKYIIFSDLINSIEGLDKI